MVDMYSRMVDERVHFWQSDTVQNRIASYCEYDAAVQSSTDTSDIGHQLPIHLPANTNGSKKKIKIASPQRFARC